MQRCRLAGPDGLAAQAIPLAARIVGAADVFNAMTSYRAFRDAKPAAEALAELEREAGKQFDPDVVAAFLAEARCLGDKLTDVPLPQAANAEHAPEADTTRPQTAPAWR